MRTDSLGRPILDVVYLVSAVGGRLTVDAVVAGLVEMGL